MPAEATDEEAHANSNNRGASELMKRILARYKRIELKPSGSPIPLGKIGQQGAEVLVEEYWCQLAQQSVIDRNGAVHNDATGNVKSCDCHDRNFH